jgi:hypothetical protein
MAQTSASSNGAARARKTKPRIAPSTLTAPAPSLKAPKPAALAQVAPPAQAAELTGLTMDSVSGWSGGAEVKLNFVNRSNDANNSSIVIFAKNASGMNELAVAWLVIENCGQGWSHPFTYPQAVSVGVSDSSGNFSPQIAAEDGQMFLVNATSSGNELSPAGQGSDPRSVQILNGLERGAIDAIVFRAGKPYATATSLAPQQRALFQFKPTIWIGVVSQLREGEVMNSAILSSINTEISLWGIASADIVMTGGGPGAGSTPFMFTLQNIVMA